MDVKIKGVCDGVPGNVRAVRLKSATLTPNRCPIVRNHWKIRYRNMQEIIGIKTYIYHFLKI